MMKKLLSIACTALAVISCNDDTKKTDSQLTVGVSADYPPFEYFSDGKIVGFDIELLDVQGNLIAGKLIQAIIRGY